ncbi:hypothetical protein QEN19_001873 [Hanseniaspora menglaensis]
MVSNEIQQESLANEINAAAINSNPIVRIISDPSVVLSFIKEDDEIDGLMGKPVGQLQQTSLEDDDKLPVFDWKRFKFNLKPNFFVYTFFASIVMAQSLFTMTTLLDLQMDKISHAGDVSITNNDDYLTFMKWSGIVVTLSQMFVISKVGELLDKFGIRFTTLTFFTFHVLHSSIMLYTMSEKYIFHMASYFPLYIIASLSGGPMVLLTIVQTGITEIFSLHEERMVHFNYLQSIVGATTFIVPFLTTFFIKKYGKYTVLKVDFCLTITGLVSAYLILNNIKPIKNNTAKIDQKDQIEIRVKRLNKATKKSKHGSSILEKFLNLKFISQFKVFLLPKTEVVGRRNVLLLLLFKIANSIQESAPMIMLTYLMQIFNYDAIYLNYLISFIGIYGSFCSVVGIKIFYYVTHSILHIEHNGKKLDKIDISQMYLTSIGSLIGLIYAIIKKNSVYGVLTMFFFLTTFDFLKPAAANIIVKYVNNSSCKNREELETEGLLESDGEETEETQIVSDQEAKNGTLYACMSIIERIVLGFGSAMFFQVYGMTKDTKPWFFLVVLLAVPISNLLLLFAMRAEDVDEDSEALLTKSTSV